MPKKLEVKSFDSPDGVRTFEKGRLELVRVGRATVGRAILEPGWKWSEHVKPIAKTKSCKAPHFQYHVSGILHIVMDDGTERDVKAGEVSSLPAGHDAWVVGNEPAIVVDFRYGGLRQAVYTKKISQGISEFVLTSIMSVRR